VAHNDGPANGALGGHAHLDAEIVLDLGVAGGVIVGQHDKDEVED